MAAVLDVLRRHRLPWNFCILKKESAAIIHRKLVNIYETTALVASRVKRWVNRVINKRRLREEIDLSGGPRECKYVQIGCCLQLTENSHVGKPSDES